MNKRQNMEKFSHKFPVNVIIIPVFKGFYSASFEIHENLCLAINSCKYFPAKLMFRRWCLVEGLAIRREAAILRSEKHEVRSR